MSITISVRHPGGDAGVTPDEKKKKKKKKRMGGGKNAPCLRALHYRNQGRIRCINGGSDEERLVFRITHGRMDCCLLMSPPE